MAFYVKIAFDGLFVFVHRPKLKEPVLVVLMANTKDPQPSHQHHHDHPEHEGWIEVEPHARRRFAGELDLSRIGLEGGSDIIECALPLSSTTGVTVEENFLTGPFADVDRKISGRITLPLPRSVWPVTSVEVEWKDAAGNWVKLPSAMSGHIELTYRATQPVTIPGFPAIDRNTKVHFTYLPPGSTIGSHPPHTDLKHSHMHSPIFRDKAPEFRTAAQFQLAAANKDGATILGGDPVVCTSGNGCPPEDITCGGG